MNRIDAVFQKLKQEGKKAFVPYIAAGDPSLEKTVDVALALERAGAHVLELGIPFSDPLADGTVNQLANQRALEAGATPQRVLETAHAIRQRSQIPLVFFTYYNPIFHFGLQRFLKEAEKAGVDGMLILDLPPEEAKREWPQDCALKRISLIAPTTPPQRIEEIVSTSSGFIYYVSREGVTGMQDQIAASLSDQVNRIRSHTSLPICVGFGISTPEQARAVAAVADGVVIGSAIVNQIAQHGSSPDLAEKIFQFVQPITSALAKE
ncbi:MAG: tryptophan synthase subunit alpha [bacterium]